MAAPEVCCCFGALEVTQTVSQATTARSVAAQPWLGYADRVQMTKMEILDKKNSRVALAYSFQYTQIAVGKWTPQHVIFYRYWFGKWLSARCGG